jgi:hypothetical protein
MQAKIKDAEGEVAFILNDWEVEVVDNTATMSAPEPAPHVILYVQAHIKTGKREVVLMGQAPVLMRPDLIIENVNAPEEVHVDAPFNVDAVIHELNGQVGATAAVNLFHGTELLASVPGVTVGAGDVASVVIAGIAFPDPGTYDLAITVTDADPGEYDDTNNSYGFTVEVVQPYNFQNSSYYFYYYNRHNTTHQVVEYTCQPDFVYDYDNWYDYGYITGTSYGDVPEADQYSIYDPDYGIQIYVYVVPSSGYTYYYTYQYSNGYRYVYNYPDGTTYEYEYNYYGMDHMDAHEFLTATILIDDNAVTLGGTATMNLSGSQNISSNSGSYNYGSCPYTYTTTYNNHYYSASSTGTLDPSVLFKGRIVADGSALPEHISLDGVYPNPFNPSTMVQFALPEGAPVKLMVFDLQGKELSRLVDGYIEAGRHEILWNGKSAAGYRLPSGVYLTRLVTPGFTQTVKMLMLK